MNQTIIELIEAREKAEQTYANVLDRLRSVTREAYVARRARHAAHRAYINAITRKEKQS